MLPAPDQQNSSGVGEVIVYSPGVLKAAHKSLSKGVPSFTAVWDGSDCFSVWLFKGYFFLEILENLRDLLHIAFVLFCSVFNSYANKTASHTAWTRK